MNGHVTRSMPELSNDLRELATECTENARILSSHPGAATSESMSLAAKNWASAALAATQASLTATRGPGR